jgi:serine protease Do
VIRAAPFLALLLACLPASAQSSSTQTSEAEQALARTTKRAVAKLAPSVVSIDAIGGLPKRFKAPKNEGEKRKGILARRGFKQAYGPSTGVIISPEGLVITSTFVLNRKPRHLFVTLADGRSYVARVLGRDDSRALALLKIDAQNLPAAAITPPAMLQVGRFSLAVGRGLGGAEPVVMRGIISALDRVGGKALQSSALISPVNYGGPLAGIDGSVMGILVPLTMKGGMASVDIYDSGIGFAIPMRDVLALVPRLAKGERLQAGFLGVVPDPTHKGEGVRIKAVAPGSPGAKAKLEPGELIVEVDGAATHAIWQLRRALGRRFAGEEVTLKVIKQTKVRTLRLRLGAPPWPARSSPAQAPSATSAASAA